MTSMRFLSPAAAIVLVSLMPVGSASAASAVQKECAAKYQAAKAANTLNGQTYNQYYKQCAAEARNEKTGAAPAPAAAAPAAPAATPAAAPAAPAAAPAATPTAAPAAPTPAAPTTAAAGAAVFPSAISPQYKTLSAGIARRKTCDDQYKLNKANNGNGGLRWIEKGGGYYSECNKRLKS